MKKLIASLIAASLLLITPVASFAAPEDFFILDIGDEAYAYTDIAVWEGALYIYRDRDGLYVYRVGDEAPQLLLTMDALNAQGQPLGSEGLAPPELIGGEGLYLLYHGALWHYDADENGFQNMYKPAQPDEDAYQTILDYAVVDGSLYAVGLNTSGTTDLLRMNEHTASPAHTSIVKIAPYQKGELLVTTQGFTAGKTLSILNLQSGALTEKMNLANELGRYLTYAADTDTAYLSDTSMLRRTVHFDKMETATYLPQEQGTPLEILALPEGWIAVNYSDSIYLAQADPAQLSGQSLRVMGYSSELPNQSFIAAYPDIPLELDSRYPDRAELLLSDIISGSGADVYILDSRMHDIRLMAEKGYLLDLSAEPVLSEAVNAMYPFAREAASPAGRLVALPFSFDTTWHLMGHSPAAFKQIGLSEADIPTTYAGLLSFIENWKISLGEQHEDMTLYGGADEQAIRNMIEWGIINGELIICAQQDKALTLDEVRIVPLLEQINRIDWTSDSPAASIRHPMPIEGDTAACLFSNYILNMESVAQYKREGREPLPLALDEDIAPVTTARLSYLVINPNSKNLGGALAYLRTMLENLTPDVRASLSPALNEPVKRPGADEEIADIKHWIAQFETKLKEAPSTEKGEWEQRIKEYTLELEQMEDWSYIVSPQAIETFRAYDHLLHMVPVNPLTSGGNEEISLLVQRYRDRQLSPAEFVSEVNRKLLMMQLED